VMVVDGTHIQSPSKATVRILHNCYTVQTSPATVKFLAVHGHPGRQHTLEHLRISHPAERASDVLLRAWKPMGGAVRDRLHCLQRTLIDLGGRATSREFIQLPVDCVNGTGHIVRCL